MTNKSNFNLQSINRTAFLAYEYSTSSAQYTV